MRKLMRKALPVALAAILTSLLAFYVICPGVLHEMGQGEEVGDEPGIPRVVGGEVLENSASPVSAAALADEPKEDVAAGGFCVPSLPSREGLDPAFGKFDRWLVQYFRAGLDQRGALIGEGVAVAEERRVAMKDLIPTDPAVALRNAVPMVVRQQLPAEVVSKLEQRISARGFYGVGAVHPEHGQDHEEDERSEKSEHARFAVMEDGKRHEVYTFGQRLVQASAARSVMSGVAVDQVMALDERRVRPLEVGEIPRPKKPRESAGLVLGETVLAAAAEGEMPPITRQTPAVEVAGTVYYLPEGLSLSDLEWTVAMGDGASGGAIKGFYPKMGSTPTDWSRGAKTILVIRAAFPDSPKAIESEATSYSVMQDCNNFFVENSYGKFSLVPTVTPLVMLSKPILAGDGGANVEAERLAREMGYDVDSYDLVVYRYPGAGGFGFYAMKGAWNDRPGWGSIAHELGHNLGLHHNGLWRTSGLSVIGNGSFQPLSNPFDRIGQGPGSASMDQHFGVYSKWKLGWLPESAVGRITRSGVYRLTAFDQPRLESGKTYALVINKDGDREYWAEFRQKSFKGNLWIRDGIVLNFAPWNMSLGGDGGTSLLDTTPGSPAGADDAPLVIGRTYSDWESSIHITPVGKAGTVPESVDVVVNIGPFPLNQAPTLSLNASSLNVKLGEQVSLTASALDPDGDPLSYAWYFSDQTFDSRNLPSVTKSFATEGEHTVRCVVSDMKGGMAERSLVVQVGDLRTFSVRGKVLAGTAGVANALISNGATGAAYRETLSGSDGSYVLRGLSSGTYTLSAMTTSSAAKPLFSNPVTVGTDLEDLNFTSVLAPAVTITAADGGAIEGGPQKGRFLISRDIVGGALTVNLSRPGGTALEGTDYKNLNGLASGPTGRTIVIPSGKSSVSVEVDALSDQELEGDETVVLSVMPGAGYAVGMNASAVVRIRDLETVVPVVRVEALTSSVREGSTTPVWRISRTTPWLNSTRVRLSVSGGATEGDDYQPMAKEVEIPAGQESIDLVLAANVDGISEGTETVFLKVEPGVGYQPTPGPFRSAFVAIVDADLSTVRVMASVPSTTEGSASPAEFVLTRTGNLARAVIVPFSLAGSALPGKDYEPVANFVQFASGQSTARVAIRAVNDRLGEAGETVVLQIASGAEYDVDAQSNATLQILDSGSVPVITVAAEGLAATIENGVAKKGGFRIRAVGTGSATIQVKYAVTGSAIPGVDYTPLTGVISVKTGGESVLPVIPRVVDTVNNWKDVTVTLLPDPAYSFFLDTSATNWIVNTALPGVSVSAIGDAREGQWSGAFLIWRTGGISSPLDVSYTMVGSAANGIDYRPLSGKVTIPANSQYAYVFVHPMDDALAEGPETVELRLVRGDQYVLGIPSAKLFIDDDAPAGSLPVEVGFASASGQASGGAGVVNVPVTLSASSQTPVNVEVYLGARPSGYFNAPGLNVESAVLGVDYQVPLGVITFAPGETTKSIPLTILGNSYARWTREVRLSLRRATGAALGERKDYDFRILNEQLGELDHFAWSVSSGTQFSGFDFPARIVAQDGANNTVSTFSGNAALRVADSSRVIGTGTVETVEFPLNTQSWGRSAFVRQRSQCIYLQSEVGAAGAIRSLSLNLSQYPNVALGSWTIRMRHTNLQSYGAAPEWESADWTTVYRSYEKISQKGWVTFRFSTPFEYDGVRNLMIDFSFSNNNYDDPGAVFATATEQQRSIHFQSMGDNRFGEPLAWVGRSPSPQVAVVLPNIQLGFENKVPLTPMVTGNFSNGVWEGVLNLRGALGDVSLIVEDTVGRRGEVSLNLVAQKPLLGAVALSSLGTTSVTFSGVLNPRGFATTAAFEVGRDVSYGGSLPVALSPNDGIDDQSVSTVFSGLIPGTEYHVRLSGTNAGGLATSEDVTFRTISTNADLAGLVVSGGTLSPGFASGVTSYAVSVPNETSAWSVTPVVADATASVKVNGVSVASGSASAPVALVVGLNPVLVEVTAQDGVTVKTYTVGVTRLPSTNADLAGLLVSGGTLSPGFVSGLTSYAVSVPYATSGLSVTPVVADATASVKVNGVSVASGSASVPVALVVGLNPVLVEVTAQDGVTVKTYTVGVTRLPSTNADLAGLVVSGGTLSPGFARGVTSYAVSVPNGTSAWSVTPVVADATASVKVNGGTVASGSASAPVALVVGLNPVLVEVTAQDGVTVKTYTVGVTRLPSTNADLAGLVVSGGTLSPGFASGVTSYAVSVPNETSAWSVTPVVADATASVKVNGVSVASGSASAPVALVVGLNPVVVEVTAPDGVTVKTYTVGVTRLPSTNADLAGLLVSGGTLSPGFASGVTSYAVSVPYA
ncbi:MAG: hypothetical protein RLZZ399_2480, partial [Verrucomicrobiota bacterium]